MKKVSETNNPQDEDIFDTDFDTERNALRNSLDAGLISNPMYLTRIALIAKRERARSFNQGKLTNWADEIVEFFCRTCDQRFMSRRERQDDPGCDCVEFHGKIDMISGEGVPSHLPVKLLEKIEQFRTSDGRTFTSEAAAGSHELSLSFNNWYEDNKFRSSTSAGDSLFNYLEKHQNVLEELISRFKEIKY